MLRTIEKIIENQMADHIIRDSDLSNLFKGTAARRYALVNKALKKGELIRICRGFYTLAAKYHPTLSQYYIANRIVPHSFITAESALSFHSWIPERITQVTSIAAFGRNRQFKTPFGIFIYRVFSMLPHHFYAGVNMIKIENQFIYIATPLRALIDYINWHKIKNANIDFLTSSLRIERDNIEKITQKEIEQLKDIYRSSYTKHFLENLASEKSHEQSNYQ